jgi:NTE family protein
MNRPEHFSPNRLPNAKSRRVETRPPFECIALLLQGGGALGAYQAGVYQALAEANLHPDWVAGISIGAINAALIAGNPPETRVDKLRAFWEGITAASAWDWSAHLRMPVTESIDGRKLANQISAASAMFAGIAGFYTPRMLTPWLQPAGGTKATSYYDTSSLRTTLERLVDFDMINANDMRFSVGAVNVRTGNFVYFDTTTHTIKPEHILASAALPPGFPSVEIEGEHYWDGGLVSNTPLQWVLQFGPRQDTLAFQVDLWSARGQFPRSMAEVATRQKEIIYSSRTRDNTTRFTASQKVRHAVESLLKKLPKEMKDFPEAKILSTFGDQKVYSLVHLIYRAKQYEGDSKDYEFSRRSMEEHWRSGYNDTVRTLRHPEAIARPENAEGISIFDIAEHGGE